MILPIVEVFFLTSLQALASCAISLLLGFFFALGLMSLVSAKTRRWIELYVLLPSLLPTLFIIVAILNLMSTVRILPIGFWGVTLAHVIINVGLVGVVLARLIENHAGGGIELATVEGATRRQILSVIVRGLKSEILQIGYFVFVLAFVSFSVPLILGGGRGDTIEVYIYRLAMGQGNWLGAWYLAAAQIIFLASFSFFIFRNSKGIYKRTAVNVRHISGRTALLLSFILTSAVLISSFSGFQKGIKEILQQNYWQDHILSLALGSFAEGVLAAALTCGAFGFIFYFASFKWLDRILFSLTAPSVVLIGLAIYLIFDATYSSDGTLLLVIAFGLSICSIPSLYRMRGAALISALTLQIEIAQVLGASRRQIFFHIVLPQVSADLGFIAGLAAFWACGDFALSSIIAGHDLTLAMAAKTLLGGYRLEVATVLTWFALLIGAMLFLIFEGLGRVSYSQSRS